MEAFRITLSKYSDKLFASGLTGRWNKHGEKVIYAASSRTLACLENLVHRRGQLKNIHFKTIVIHIPDKLAIQRVELNDLPERWEQDSAPDACRDIGSSWYQSNRTPILSVPSAVIPFERNLVIDTSHPNFSTFFSNNSIAFFLI
ncbi:RES domain-containing protein [Catalinimonas sp. 4WD22]|uniref:RES family NAD+ phosphorylase n=1 Tax=Catalinimonas locisalis TaxID=3133978 RepID=UPI00310161ED